MEIPQFFLLEQLPESPDGALKSMISLTIILFFYLYPVVRVFIMHWSMPIFASLLAKYNRNVFVRHHRRRRSKCRLMPTLYARSFDTADEHSKYSFSWDMDGIPFVIGNSVNAVI